MSTGEIVCYGVGRHHGGSTGLLLWFPLQPRARVGAAVSTAAWLEPPCVLCPGPNLKPKSLNCVSCGRRVDGMSGQGG